LTTSLGGDPGSLYDAEYYRTHCGSVPYGRSIEWLTFFGGMADQIVAKLAPRRVLDAGCAWGLLVEFLRQHGVDAWGIDISSYAISQVREDMRPFCRVASLTEPLGDRFDLITCIEVLEHLSPFDARLAAQRIAEATDTLLFSSTPDDFDEPTHCNVQPVIAWLDLFSGLGFEPDLLFDASFVAPHAFLLRRTGNIVLQDVKLLFSEKLRLHGEVNRRDEGIARLKRALDSSTDQLKRFKLEMAQVCSGPAWAIVSRYRRWLRGHQLRNSMIWRTYEPVMAWILGTAAAPATSAAADAAEAGDADCYREWYLSVEPSESRLALQRKMAAQFSYRPLISVLVPIFQVPFPVLQETVESVLRQTYDRWELCIAHGDTEDTRAREYLSRLCEREPRVKLKLLSGNHGISGNSNEALSLVTGEFVALLDHDDTLAPFALFEVAQALRNDPALDFIYSDKDEIDASGRRRLNPLFKPSWSPGIMLSANYLTHLTVMRTARVRAIGGWRPETDGAQDWDLFLRFIGPDSRVHHIPRVLYHWRRLETSVAARGYDAKPYAPKAQLTTLRDHLSRSGSKAGIGAAVNGLIKLVWENPAPGPVSIIVVQRSAIQGTISFAERALALAGAGDFEVVIASSEPAIAGDPRIRVLPAPLSQSLAARLNGAVEASRGNALIFLDESVEITDKAWTREMTGPLEDPEIGLVGAKLIDSESGRIRHAGLVFDGDAKLQPVFAGEQDGHCHEFGSVSWYRNWLAVSGAAFSIRRDTFLKVGKFSEYPDFPRLDVDLCLRVRFHTGGRAFYNPFARMLKTGTASIEQWISPQMSWAGTAFVRRCFPLGDPYFNPNLVCANGRIGFKSASQTAPKPDNPFSIDAQILVSECDASPSAIALSRTACAQPVRRNLQTISWFVPVFTNPFYGGIHTILRFADYFHSTHQVQSRFVVVGQGRAEDFKECIARAFPELADSSAVTIFTNAQAAILQPADAAVATLWRTAYPVLAFNRTRRKFYFLQDYEPSFYPAGSTSALVEATYTFGFFGICNTLALRDKYAEHGGEGEYFNPCVDSSVFHSRGRRNGSGEPFTVFFYGRPAHPRNCFELVSAAMKILKSRMGDRVRIVAAGSEWDPARYGLGGVVENLGNLDYRDTGPLYRTCDAGVTMMMTAHPSYLPLELMASGTLVVSTQNPRTAWFLKDRVNCLVALNSPSAVADAVEEGLLNHELRKTIADRAAEIVSKEYSQWDTQAEKIYQYMLQQC
jgi:glycosyltransferase involved in cell wall biosynthesis/GT2 family glycosyltransferase/SAM-dependent methyltransferase